MPAQAKIRAPEPSEPPPERFVIEAGAKLIYVIRRHDKAVMATFHPSGGAFTRKDAEDAADAIANQMNARAHRAK